MAYFCHIFQWGDSITRFIQRISNILSLLLTGTSLGSHEWHFEKFCQHPLKKKPTFNYSLALVHSIPSSQYCSEIGCCSVLESVSITSEKQKKAYCSNIYTYCDMRTVVTYTKNICLHHEGIATYVAKRNNDFWNFRLQDYFL